jgi:hypothetical protein
MRAARRSVLALALALAALQSTAATDEIGTLFNPPEERERLDRLRRGDPLAATTGSEAGRVVTRKPVVTGYVQRSDGRNTVWIDGRPVVVGTPEAKELLDPRVVHPNPSDNVVRTERGPAPER